MFAPRLRLIQVTSAVLPIASLIYAFVPSLWPFSLVTVAFLVGVAIWDLSLSLNLLDGISASLPKRFSLSRNRDATLSFHLDFSPPCSRQYRLAPHWPDNLSCRKTEITVHNTVPHERLLITVLCCGVRRGVRPLRTIYLGTPSRWGFWEMRTNLQVDCEIQVYPDVRSEQARLTALTAGHGWSGAHAFPQVGKGRDFEKLREYVPGDGYEDIHWKATAKRRHPITKVFQLERTQDVYLVIDSSRLSGRACGPNLDPKDQLTYLEKNLAVTLLLANQIEHLGDRVGFLAYADRVQCFLRAASGRVHYNACRNALFRLETSQATPDYRELLSYLRGNLHRRSLIIFFASLDDSLLMENFLENVDGLRRQHVILVVCLRPTSVRPLFQNEKLDSLEEIYQELAGHERWENLTAFQRQLKRRGIDLLFPEVDRLAFDVLNNYLSIKRRQLL